VLAGVWIVVWAWGAAWAEEPAASDAPAPASEVEPAEPDAPVEAGAPVEVPESAEPADNGEAAPERGEDDGPAPVDTPAPTVDNGAAVSRPKVPVSTLFTDDFELRYWAMPDRLPGFPDLRVLDYVEQVNRFTGNVRVGEWSIYAQLDQVALAGNSFFLDGTRRIERDLVASGTFSPLLARPYDPATTGLSGWDLFARNVYFNLEKLRVTWASGPFTLEIGDTYAVFGRGAPLNLNRNVDIDVDTSLQGVKFTWQPGAWDVVGMFGQLNRQQVFQDNPNRLLFGDRRHTVGGVSVSRYGLGPVNIGGHGVVYNFVADEGWKEGFEELGTLPDAVVGGGWIEVLGAGPTDWAFAADGFAWPTDAAWGGQPRKPGYSLYASGSIYAGRASILLEGKRYFQTQHINTLLAPELYQVAIAPTLEYERQITEDSAAALGSNDIWGGLARVDVAAVPGVVTPYASFAVFRDLDIGGLHFNSVPETILHPLVGVEFTGEHSSVIFNAGYRLDLRDKVDGTRSAGADRHLHGDVLARIPLHKDWYLDVAWAAEWYRWGNNRIQQADYVETESALTVQKGSLFAFTWYLDYSTNPLIGPLGNLTPNLYGAGEVQVKPLPSLTIKAFYGAYKAGIRCAGGQCRVLPAFNGARVSVQAAF
jgi:hypothetical protein